MSEETLSTNINQLREKLGIIMEVTTVIGAELRGIINEWIDKVNAGDPFDKAADTVKDIEFHQNELLEILGKLVIDTMTAKERLVKLGGDVVHEIGMSSIVTGDPIWNQISDAMKECGLGNYTPDDIDIEVLIAEMMSNTDSAIAEWADKIAPGVQKWLEEEK